MAVALGKPTPLRDGPWVGVYNTTDPFDEGHPNRLIDARNGYVPDPTGRSGFYSRPGFILEINQTAVYSSATTFKGQGVYTHFGLDGSPVNFCAFGGQLFRLDGGLTTATNVTPVGVVIDGDVSTRVYFESLGGVMCVNDGVHRPWVASNISATPITGTYIDFDSVGGSWVAFGPPRVFGGSGFFILRSYGGAAASIDIAWTEPNDWTVGFQQTNYDNRWTLEQTGTTPLYALAPSNVALNYFRQRSIGSIAGTVGPDLATTATHDAVAANVGTEAPQTIVQFGDAVYFCDVVGRPWRFVIGSSPEPIWLQMRAIVDAASVAYPLVSSRTATAAFEPTLNLYCVAIWSPSPGSAASPVEWHTFDAKTGTYLGRWSIGPTATGASIDCLGTILDDNGRGTFVALGSATSGGVSGYLWGMNSLSGVPFPVATEDGVTILDTEDAVTMLTIEGQPQVWKDNGDVPLITGTTDRLGYAEDIVWLYDSATILTGNDSPITVTITTPNAADTLEGTPTPNASADGVYRSVCGLDLQGRGAAVTVSPTTADEQWSLQRVTVVAIPSAAGPDDA